MKEFTKEEVAKHSQQGDAWIIIDGVIYDVSKFADMHPGGELLLLQYAGKDATKEFYAFHRHEILLKYQRLQIGVVSGAKSGVIAAQNAPGSISKVPFAEPSFWQGHKSAYFTDSHLNFRTALRSFIESVVAKEAAAHEDSGKAPEKELYSQMGRFGLLAAR
jgi:predicted heme/steroid binding protein